MKIKYLTPQIITHILGRLEGHDNISLLEIPRSCYDVNNNHLLTYSNQGDAYFFDLFCTEDGLEFGLEGSVSTNKFTLTEYTNKNFNRIELDLPESYTTSMDDGEFFQLSTVTDFHGLTYEQLFAILWLRDSIIRRQPQFSVTK
jgi:hypothetical protein